MVHYNPLEVEEVLMYEKENAIAHHTSNFDVVHSEPSTPVLRRGQSFNLTLKFDHEFNAATDIVRLIFTFGAKPNGIRGTRRVVTVRNEESHDSDLDDWVVRTTGAIGNDLSVKVTSPVDCPVGVWRFRVETTVLEGKQITNSYDFNKDIYMLFNPWVKEDLVYMENEKLLGEYVLNDLGKVWVGSWGSHFGRAWVFGQFDADVLPSCQMMLERSGIKAEHRGDPIQMCRAISRIVNSNDDRGVLAGNWDGQYENGTPPAAWTGSVPILKKFLKTGDSVLYGQCWVFAAVVTTVCRALGIPSRVVTNLVSAHDSNGSMSIDWYLNSENKELKCGNDSIWNFHVWNDVWMARPDLPKGYGGWQAIDATPQETSDGVFQCGPASLEAIRVGDVGQNYDVAYMIASVNADVMRWKEDDRSEIGYTMIQCNKYHIGRAILTKAPFAFDPNGERDREDITLQYKAREGTEAERLALYNAVSGSAMAKRFYRMPINEEVKFELVDLDRVDIGNPFSVILNIQNNSTEVRNIHAMLCAASVFYNGVKAGLVKKSNHTIVMPPNSTKQITLPVTMEDYLDKLVEYGNMKLCAIATVEETKQTWADEDDFQVLKPKIQFEVQDKLVVGKSTTLTLSFKNPLHKTLTGCKFHYEGAGLKGNRIMPFGDVGPGEDLLNRQQFVPHKTGQHTIVATFTSKELLDVIGSAIVTVLDEKELNES